jgi:hypothetical protein
VTDTSEHGPFQVAYLPFTNQPHTKKILIYFLPLLDPSEEKPRIINISYTWPGYFLHLQQKLEENLSFTLQAKDVIELMQFEVYLEPGTGKKLICDRGGVLSGKQKLEEAIYAQDIGASKKEWTGWKYTILDGPPGEYGLTLQLETN